MKLFRRKKLLHRLLVIVLLVALLPLAIAGFYFIHNATKELEAAAQQKLKNQAALLATVLSEQYLAKWNEFLLTLQGAYSHSRNLAFCQKLIKNSLRDTPAYVAIQRVEFFSGPSYHTGRIVYESPNYRHFFRSNAVQRFLKSITGQNQSHSFLLSHVYYSSLDSCPYALFTRLPSGSYSGQDFFVLIVNLVPVMKGLHDYATQQGWKTKFLVWDGLQQPVSIPGRLSFHNEIQQRKHVVFSAPAVSAPFSTYRFKSATGQIWLGALANVSTSSQWKLTVEMSRQQAIRAISNLWVKFWLLIVFGILIALSGALYYWKKIADPIERFTKSATEIARGNFSQRVEVDSNDEIGRLAKIFNYMVEELRRLHNMNLNKIISERAKTQTIIRNIADGVIVTDVQDRIVLVNNAIEQWFNIRESQLLEKSINEVIGNVELLKLLEEVKETRLESTFTREISLQLPQQHDETVFQAKATRIYGREDELMGVVTVLRDITKEKEIDRMKTDLVSLVAHELRSPLTSISGFAELLLETAATNNNIAEYVRIIKQESDRLAALVNKFLDLARIEAGRIDFKPAKINLNELVESLLYFANLQAQEKDTKIDVYLPPKAVTAYVDEKMISEVILNLLSNAVKYSPPHSKVALYLKELNDKEVVLQVVDNGYGIAKAHLDRIFEKFYRIKEAEELREERGTGLGLALVKQIVELHHGRIEVESEVGKGSIFRVILPKNLPQEQSTIDVGYKLIEDSQGNS